jgi:photosystem II stability/assembly factor-like uncharacterized protein
MSSLKIYGVKKMKKIFIIIMFLFPETFFAQNMGWKHTGGPKGGIIGDMVINSNDEIYAGAYGFITPTFEFKYYSGLYKSTDNGNSWIEIETQFDPFRIYALYINNAGHILVGTDHQGRIYRSTDNGVTWENNNSGYNTGECWAFGESNDGILFAGSGEGQVYRSTDNGDSWVLSANLPSLVFATDTNNVVYCGTFNGLYKSTDNGTSWQQDNYFTNVAVSSVLVDSSNNVYCSTGYYSNGNGVYYSTNGGGNWLNLGLEGKVTLSLAFDSKGFLYAGTKSDGLYKTTDMGQNWIRHQNGIEGIEVFRLKINSEDYIFIGSENEGVYRSTDGGDSFTQIGLPISHIQNIDFSPDKNFIFASTPSGVQRYNRTTGIWENKGLRDVEAVSVSPSGYLYAATFPDGLYFSINSGDKWTKMDINTNIIEIYNCKAISDSILILSAYPKFALSNDAGNTWELAYFGGSPWNSTILSGYDEWIYLNGGNIYLTNNFGQSFIEITAPSGISRKRGLSINSNGEIFFLNRQGNQSPGIYANTVPPSSWVKIYSGITNSIYINSQNIIYVSSTEGIILSANNGDNWKLIFDDNPSRAFAHDLKVDGDILFIATNSYGLYELQIPTSVGEGNDLITSYKLYQNYPNPFNPSTKIKYSIPLSQFVQVKVYDILGQEIKTILNEHKQAGIYEIEFNAEALPSGVYFYKLQAGEFLETKKMILLR